MQQQSSVPAPPSTRELRGLKLYREHGAEIEPLGKGVYRVPGCSGGTYTVDLAVFTDEPETCNCPDYKRQKQTCNHPSDHAGVPRRYPVRATDPGAGAVFVNGELVERVEEKDAA